jgi:catechol 2,3-dioxygenase-like lactoylglutathione lyase family enzyme
MIKQIIHFYRVDSLEKAAIFYQDIMGLSLYKDQKECLIYHVEHVGHIGFCKHFPKDVITQSCITFVYQTPDEVDQMYHRLTDLGYEPSKPETNPTFGIYHFFLKDPNGLMVECQVFL